MKSRLPELPGHLTPSWVKIKGENKTLIKILRIMMNLLHR